MFHLFEQHVGTLLADWTGKRPKFPFEELGKLAFTDKAGNTVAFNSARDGQRWTNCVKHAEGDSATKLRAVNDSHFKLPSVRGTDLEKFFGERILGEPLTGEGVYVVMADFDRFVVAVLDFWKWLADFVD